MKKNVLFVPLYNPGSATGPPRKKPKLFMIVFGRAALKGLRAFKTVF
jgi:hypothetical protein